MKSHTDLEQSRKLAEFLPLESADMYWWSTSKRSYIEAMDDGDFNEAEGHIRAWSLSALLGVLPFPALRYDIEDGEGGWIVSCEKNDKMYLSYYKDNPVDTCYEMILKLHEQKIL